MTKTFAASPQERRLVSLTAQRSRGSCSTGAELFPQQRAEPVRAHNCSALRSRRTRLCWARGENGGLRPERNLPPPRPPIAATKRHCVKFIKCVRSVGAAVAKW